MAAEDSPESLPQGWTPHFEARKSGPKVKYYLNSGTGQKFYSKADLMRYVKAQNPQPDQPQLTEPPVGTPSNNNQMHLIQHTNERPEWLPDGWIVELKTRKSGLFKCYVDPSTGCKFSSKPQVFRHLKTVMQKSSTTEQKEMPKSIVPESKLIEYTNEKPEWLPHGWIMEIKTNKSGAARGKKYKVFVDPSTGCKFFSKPEVFRYLKTVEKKSSTSKQKEMSMSIVPTSQVTTGKSSSEDLPPGWIKEFKVRKNAYNRTLKDPFYTDPESGYVFRSKRDVHRYLETGDIRACKILPRKRDIEDKSLVTTGITTGKSSSEDLPPGWIKEFKVRKTAYNRTQKDPVSTGKSISDDLPPGWIKEFKVRKTAYNRTQKDPYYTDPESGYVFRSKRDVHRYLETGDINACASLPRKRNTEDESLPSSSTKRRKLEHSVTSHQLSGETGSSDVGSVASPLVYSRNRGTKTESAITTLPVVITVDISVQRSPRTDDIDSKENSNKNWSPPPKAEDLERNEDKNTSAMIKREERYPTRNSLSKSKHQKWLNMPRRCSNRLAGFEPDMVINSLSIVPLSSEVNKKKRKNSGSGTEEVGSYETSTQDSLTKSKKACALPLRSSKLLAGFGPEQVANSTFIVQALPRTDGPPNDEATMAVGLNEGVMTQSEPREELELHTSSDANNPLLGEPSTGSQGYDTTSKSSGKGQVIMINADDLPIITPEADMKQEIYLDNVNKQGNKNNPRACREKKEFNLPRRSSKRLASVEPEMKANSVSVPDGIVDEAQASKLIPTEHGLETPHPPNGEPGEPSNKNQPFLDAQAGSDDKLQLVEVNKSDDKKSESEFIPPLGEIFSDPCLEFAFKTLTGEFPVEVASVNEPVSTPAADITAEKKAPKKMDNMLDKSNFQQQAEPSQTRTEGQLQDQSEISQSSKDVSSTIPDYSFRSFFQTDVAVDVSVHLESREQGLSSEPQMPVKNNPFLSSGSENFSSFSGVGGGFSSFSGIGSQQPPLIKKSQPFSSFSGIGSQPPPPIKKNQPSPLVKKTRGRPRKVNS